MPVVGAGNALIDAIRFGATLVQARVTIYSAGVPTEYLVPVSIMTVTVDRNSAQRRQGSITVEVVPDIPPPPLLPTNPASLLAPFGNELYLEVGIGVGNASGGASVAQWIPLGLFSMATVVVSDTTIDCVITIDFYDRSWVISQRQFIAPYNFPATASGNFVAEIEQLITYVWGTNQATGQPIPKTPPLSFNIAPTSAVVPTASYNQGSDPWQAALDMAAAVGYELFFDINGVVTGYPIPVPSEQPITWNFTDDPTSVYGAGGANSGGGSTQLLGDAYSTPTAVAVTLTRDGIFNDVYVTGTGTSNAPFSTTGSSAPVLAHAADNNPSSATYVGGPMGDIPEFVSSNQVTTSAQALTTAQSDLLQALSGAWQISITIPPNPLFDIDDVVTVTRPRVGLNNVPMVIDTITYTISYADLCVVTGRVVT